MKSKKLFAILTLVAFMMTLVPAFAFAAGPVVPSVSGTKVTVDDDTIDIYSDFDDVATFTLTFNKLVSGKYVPITDPVKFYVKSDSDALVGFVSNTDDDEYDDETDTKLAKVDDANGQAITIKPTDDGKVYVYVGSYAAGEFTLSFYNGPADTEEYKNTKLLGKKTITVDVGSGSEIELEIDAAVATGDQTQYDYTAEIGDDITLKATLTDAVGNPIEGETIVFKKKYGNGSYTTIAEVETDEDGEAELDVEETRAGLYAYRAVLKSDKDVHSDVDRESNEFDKVTVAWTVERIDRIVAKTADGVKLAKGEKASLDFYIYDANGNLIKNDASAEIAITVDEMPSKSKAEKIEKSYADTDNDGIIEIEFTPDKVGTYEFTVKAKNSKAKETLTVVCKEFGTVESMTVELENDQPSIMDGVDGTLEVTLIDEDGVEKTASNSDLKFGSSNRDAVTVSSAGVVTVADDEFTGDVTITVIHEETGVSAEYTLNVVGQPVSFNPVVNVNGKRASVELQFVDKNGNRTFSSNADDNKLTLILPSGVSSEAVEDFDEDTGVAKFDLVAAKAGEYTIIANASAGITKSFKVAFEVPASEVVVVGAKNVTMFIGNAAYVQDGVAKVTDVAPFIKDNRTFVAIRPVADAFGCEIGWDEATQTVTLTRDDLTVTIVIGSSDILVVKDGVTTTVTADVPAFIQDGRTVLPFRAIGNAFGATVNYDAATQSVSYVQ